MRSYLSGKSFSGAFSPDSLNYRANAQEIARRTQHDDNAANGFNRDNIGAEEAYQTRL